MFNVTKHLENFLIKQVTFFTASSIAACTCFSSLTSTMHGNALPPSASTEIKIQIYKSTISVLNSKTHINLRTVQVFNSYYYF